MNLNRKPWHDPNAKLTDASPMPPGWVHSGTPMAQVPVDYLHHLWHNCGLKHNPESNLADYIRRSLSALKKENKDLIWS